MLLREDAEHRNITNVKDVKRALEKLGYIPYNPAFDSLERQAYTFSRATHVVGLHGAALTNLVWCDRTLTLIEIIPAHHQDYGYRGLCGAKKIRHNVFIADTCNQPTNLVRPPPYRDVVIDVDKLCEFVLQTEKDNG
jgi:capsular polysaccharide biosynthesis protein